MFPIRLLIAAIVFCLASGAVLAEDWNLPHPQGKPLTAPGKKQGRDLRKQMIRQIIEQKKSGIRSDLEIIQGIRYNFKASQKDEQELAKAGFNDDVIEDIVARGNWRGPGGSQPLKGRVIRETDRLHHNFVSTNDDKFLRAEIIDVWDGLCHIDFINQTDHIVDLHFLTFGNGTRNVNFVSDLRNDDVHPAGTNVLTVNRYNSKGRFGQNLVDYYDTRFYPHPQNVDKSRFDIWKQDNRFTGTSSAFNDPRWKTQPPNPGSIRKSGDFIKHYSVQVEDPIASGPMTLDAFYCYSYRDNDGALFTRCNEIKGGCNAHSDKDEEDGKKAEKERQQEEAEKKKLEEARRTAEELKKQQQEEARKKAEEAKQATQQNPEMKVLPAEVNFELGLYAELDVTGPSFDIPDPLFMGTATRSIAKQGLGSGSYETPLVTYQEKEGDKGKFLFFYMLDVNDKNNPHEKFYVSMNIYPKSGDYRGVYPLTADSDDQLAVGLLISEFHFSNHPTVRRNKMRQLDIRKGLVTIQEVNAEGIFGTIELEAEYVFDVQPEYSKNDACLKGKEGTDACSPTYQIKLSNARFGARKK